MARFPVIDAYNFAEDHDLSEDVDRIRSYSPPDVDPKFRMTSVRRTHMVELLRKHGILEEFFKKYWNEGFEDNGKRELREYENRRIKYEKLLESEESDIYEDEENDISSSAFAYEADLQSFLSKNLEIIEEGLKLHSDDRGSGREYPVERGRIDLLAKDKNGRFVVIELKLSQGRSKAIGQLLYYMGWIDDELGGEQPCRGILIAREIQNDVITASKRTNGIELFEYNLQVSLKKICGTDLCQTEQAT